MRLTPSFRKLPSASVRVDDSPLAIAEQDCVTERVERASSQASIHLMAPRSGSIRMWAEVPYAPLSPVVSAFGVHFTRLQRALDASTEMRLID